LLGFCLLLLEGFGSSRSQALNKGVDDDKGAASGLLLGERGWKAPAAAWSPQSEADGAEVMRTRIRGEENWVDPPF
jgi:hypothetical protein